MPMVLSNNHYTELAKCEELEDFFLKLMRFGPSYFIVFFKYLLPM